MGLLTDPRAGNMKIIKFILQWQKLLCFLMYIAGVTWISLLALPAFNDNTYFSENALLPGLVTKQSNLDASAKQFHQELVSEMKRYPDGMPYSWILAKFNQLHLDVYTHNFTLNYPFKKQQFTGQNVYGIVRAPRSSSTEAIIVSVPYRPINSVHITTAPSIALLLAFAKFCRKQKYWAKDIIFLVTEHEQLGMQAWLDAYHGVVSGQEDILIPGDLSGRAGSIQAAINLELHAMKISYIDVKVEGLNGQLPNLDLFNLAQNMIKKEEIRRSFQKKFDIYHRNKFKRWLYYFNTLSSMIVTQATGVPTGNHGLFHRYGIEAITLEGFERTDRGNEANFNQVGKVVESIIRSLNNLLERFHQSFFFYLLPSTDRYISIGLYMPSLVLIVGSLFIKAFSMWLKLQDIPVNTDNSWSKTSKVSQCIDNEEKSAEDFQVGNIASEILWCHLFGVAVMSSPKLVTSLGMQFFNLQTEDSIYYGFFTMTLLMLMWFFFVKRSSKYDNTSLICVVVLVELATTLMCIGMHNFSFALLTSIIYVPIILLINPKQEPSFKYRKLLYIFWTLLHPFVIVSVIVMGYTYFHFSEDSIMEILEKGINASKKSFVFSIIDSMIYGNWLYNIGTSVLLPIWLLLSNVIAANTVNY
ncbi:glycosylphosphatidylinositol anchor attachment 1 protein [Microplitis demolitor]|uniref:glycosylphosphatidylinositol anchor attachment 1 protein n=1 Tax=Microplitis demolitor TaxID=69319 RepID=UPI0004CDAB2E|nr:glycosylphosphatidylinositol anchor attachment 1 protein [Microplitis demolitor]XP_053596121.1 glycosylphosphatidylinositol anchor attachment 1 protein [Microplitis demolitor]XP_053596122.1 glycosylphosphatidylinositol anchor attachment 1 protein [Microplitis demolitor]XP_053596123.1 glycosylphosphatidylinositol anchor attachment 1 protein [Microplitis demolitor]